jgi:hypothetical protein
MRTPGEEAWARRLGRAAALLSITIALLVSVRGLALQNTWYLASDQFAFLTLAEDLRDGRLTRTDFFYDYIPPHFKASFDAYAQTYQIREGTLHSRYPPGFSALLAVVGALFGQSGEHALNPILFLVTLVILARLTFVALERRGEMFALGSAATATWLIVLLPTDIHLWGITVARDLPAHLLGLLALLAGVRRRWGIAGFTLGLAAVIRPDAVLWGVSLGTLALVHRDLTAFIPRAAIAFLIGAAPLFAYNWALLGNPLSFTQGSEFQEFLGAMPSLVTSAHAAVMPAGGGFRAAHFTATMHGNLSLLAGSFGAFVLPALAGAGWSAARAPLLAAAFVPYAVLAAIFYGFWSHPDPRYLVGVSLCLIALTSAALVAWAEWVLLRKKGGFPWIGALLPTIALALYLLVFGATAPAHAPFRPALVVAVTITLLALGRRIRPGARLLEVGAPIAIAVALTLFASFRVANSTGIPDPYSREQIEAATANVEKFVEPGSVLLTSVALGRPAENMTHYTSVRAAYLSEIPLTAAKPQRAIIMHLLAGRRVFLLLPPGQRSTLDLASAPILLAQRHRIPPGLALDWFLDPRRTPQGAVLFEAELDLERVPALVRSQLAPTKEDGAPTEADRSGAPSEFPR